MRVRARGVTRASASTSACACEPRKLGLSFNPHWRRDRRDSRVIYLRGGCLFMPEVLVVDDSKVMREMVVACLRPEASLAMPQASSGLEAIEQLSIGAFDLLVLDLNMPDIGGLEVIEF